MLLKYETNKGRDFIFLIDQLIPMSDRKAQQMNKAIVQIFDNHIQPNDRVCLIKFGKERYAEKIFSLVVKKQNLTQLRNQLLMIHKDFEGSRREIREADRKLFAKAIKTTLGEFKNHIQN